MPPTRRSKRKKDWVVRYNQSAIRRELESVLEAPGGVSKTLSLIQSASDGDIKQLNESDNWTPLVVATFRLGQHTTKNGNTPKSEEQLEQLIRACHERKLSFNLGAPFGGHWHHPLVVASYYGYHSAVRLMIELGALPDLGDGDGRNAWFAAFQAPSFLHVGRLRECDRQTAQVLLDMGVVMKDLEEWRRRNATSRGSVCYMNGDSTMGSAMSKAIRGGNVEVVLFLCNAGGVLSDRDYLLLRRKGKVKSKLIPMVATVLCGEEGNKEGNRSGPTEEQMQKAKSWCPEVDWSFPPTWKAGVKLCQHCGLPEEIFWENVVPFMDRDWFYSNELLGDVDRGPISVVLPFPPLFPSAGAVRGL